MKKMYIVVIFTLLFFTYGCQTSHVVEVKPMHITVDVNVKIDRALDEYFGDLDKSYQESTIKKEK